MHILSQEGSGLCFRKTQRIQRTKEPLYIIFKLFILFYLFIYFILSLMLLLYLCQCSLLIYLSEFRS